MTEVETAQAALAKAFEQEFYMARTGDGILTESTNSKEVAKSVVTLIRAILKEELRDEHEEMKKQ